MSNFEDIKKLRDTLKLRQPIYKRVKVLMPHCPICKEQLRGDNSLMLPWECSCGVWENSFTDPFNYKIKIEAL